VVSVSEASNLRGGYPLVAFHSAEPSGSGLKALCVPSAFGADITVACCHLLSRYLLSWTSGSDSRGSGPTSLPDSCGDPISHGLDRRLVESS